MTKSVMVVMFTIITLLFAGCNENNKNNNTDNNVNNTGETTSADAQNKDNLTTQELYEGFLSGTVNLYNDRFNVKRWMGDEEVTFDDSPAGMSINEFVNNMIYSEIDGNYNKVKSIEYAYIDCGGDGESELVIKVQSDEYYGETSNKQAVIKAIDGRLQLCHIATTYYRSYEDLIGKEGLIVEGGSNGAYSHYCGYAVIDKDGIYHKIMDEYQEYGFGMFYPEMNNVTAAAAAYENQLDMDALLRIVSFYDGDGSEPTVVYGTNSEDNELVKQIFADAGETITSEDEISSMLLTRLQKYGINSVIFDDDEASQDWKEVDISKAGLTETVKYGINPVYVKNVDEMVDAIANDTTIILEPGEYNLSEWVKNNSDKIQLYTGSFEIDKRGICFMYNNGPEFCINGIRGLTIVSKDENNQAHIVGTTNGSNAITFINCENIELKNVFVGHEISNDNVSSGNLYSGGIIANIDSYMVNIKNCKIRGGSSCGVYSENSTVDVKESIIFGCEFGCAKVVNDSYINFSECEFRDSKDYPIFEILDSSAAFNKCTLNDLYSDIVMMSDNAHATFFECIYDKKSLDNLSDYNGMGSLTVLD